MNHYPDIQSWPEEKLHRVMSCLFESGFELEQEPRESWSAWTQNEHAVILEKHRACCDEFNRRIAIAKSQEVEVNS